MAEFRCHSIWRNAQESIKDNLTPQQDSLEPTESEKRLLAGLRKNPLMAEQISVLMKEFEEEIANGMNADEAEERLVNAMQQLGKTMMHQWEHNPNGQKSDGNNPARSHPL